MKKYLFYLLLMLPALSYAQATVGFKRTAQGAQYKIFTPNTGEHIKLNDVITFDAVQKTDKDSVLFSSYMAGHPVKLQVQPSQNICDLMDIFPLLAVNDSALVKIPTDSVFIGHEESRPPFLPKGSDMIFLLKITRIQSLNEAIAEKNAAIEKMRTDEKSAADKYIAAHKLPLKQTASGLRYVITHPSVKRKIMPGDTLLINYAGRTTAGVLFDTSVETLAKASGLSQPGRTYEPLEVILGESNIIKGWDEGLLLLSEGSKATFVIPSQLAYGEEGQGQIPPFSTLVFDIDVVKDTPQKGKSAAVHAAKKAPLKKTVKQPQKKSNKH